MLKLALIFALLSLPLAGIAQVYSWVGPDGVRHFSGDKPPVGTAFTTVETGKFASGPVPGSAPARKETRMGGGAALRDEGLALKVATLERCAKARETIASLNDAAVKSKAPLPDPEKADLAAAKLVEEANCT